jgi:hypothetical protein
VKITYQLKPDGRDAYTVLSDSGRTYTVRYMGPGDADPDYVAIWECDCEASWHGRICKHIRAVATLANVAPICQRRITNPQPRPQQEEENDDSH